MTHSTKIFIATILATTIIVSLISLSMHLYTCDKYFIEYLDGFWVGNTIDDHVMIYFENGAIRIIESNDILETSITDKCKYELSKKTWCSMYDRSYDLKLTETDTIRSKIGKLLSNQEITIDLFSIEGACIIRDDSKDIVTLVKDINSNLELI